MVSSPARTTARCCNWWRVRRSSDSSAQLNVEERLPVQNDRVKPRSGAGVPEDGALLEAARHDWDAGRLLQAGRLLYERLLPEQRPGWAAAALELVRSRFPPTAAVDTVLALAGDTSRWHEGHAAFQAVRYLTLLAEREAKPAQPDPRYYSFLMLAENTAKVIYNASGSPAPFDRDSGWWVVCCLHSLVGLFDDPGFSSEAWEVVSRGPASYAVGRANSDGHKS